MMNYELSTEWTIVPGEACDSIGSSLYKQHMVQRQCYVGRDNIQTTKKVGMRKRSKTNLNWIETIFKSTFSKLLQKYFF